MRRGQFARMLIWGCLAAGALGPRATPAHAQIMREHTGQGAVRGFHGATPLGGGITRSFQSDNEAKAELDPS